MVEASGSSLPVAIGVSLGWVTMNQNSRLYFGFNNFFYMTGGKIINNTVIGNGTTAAAVIVGGVFQKTGGEISGNTVIGAGNIGGQVAVIRQAHSVQHGAVQSTGLPSSGTTGNLLLSRASVRKADAGPDVSLFVDWGGMPPQGRDMLPMKVPEWWGDYDNWE